MKYKLITILQWGIIAGLLFTTIKAIGLPDGCIATGLDGRYLCWQNPTTASTTVSKFDLSHWKLQIPGPKEIIPIGDYTSKYFSYGKEGEMIFWVDSSEKGTTPNSSYVRSELREMLNPNDKNVNWSLKGTHSINAELSVKTNTPQVTIIKIHGIGKDGESVKPLLRLAVMDGDLYAWLKLDKNGEHTEKILLQRKVGRFTAEILVKDYELKIKVNNETKLSRKVSYWTHNNYFKAGNYPQAESGITEVRFYKLEVKH